MVTKIFIANVGQPQLARSAMFVMLCYCLSREVACSFAGGVVAPVASVAQLVAQMVAVSFYYV